MKMMKMIKTITEYRPVKSHKSATIH